MRKGQFDCPTSTEPNRNAGSAAMSVGSDSVADRLCHPKDDCCMQQVRHVAAIVMQHLATERVPPGIVFRIVLDPDWSGLLTVRVWS